MRSLGVLYFVLFVTFIVPSVSQAEDKSVINLMYFERIPFTSKDQGHVVGLLVTPLEKAFHDAGIPFRWVEIPAKRQLAIVKSNVDLDCGVGWYKRTEREKYGKYSKAFIQDIPTTGIISSKSSLPEKIKISDLAKDKNLQWSLIDGIHYDDYIEKTLKENQANVQTLTGEFRNLIDMINGQRTNITLVSGQEANYYLSLSRYKENLRALKFEDSPEGELRYLLCSFRVDDTILAKLNKFLSVK